MTPERRFSILILVALVGRLPLIFLPSLRWARATVSIAILVVLAVVYAAIVATTFGRSEGGSSSLVLTFLFGPAGLLVYLTVRALAPNAARHRSIAGEVVE